MFVLLVGPKGSGKSHIGRILDRRLGVSFFHVEPLWMSYHAECAQSGRRPDIPEGIARIHPLIADALRAHDHVCVETTGASPEILDDLLSLAGPPDRLVARVSAPMDLCLERIAARDEACQIPMDVESIRTVDELSRAARVPADLTLESERLTEAEIVSRFAPFLAPRIDRPGFRLRPLRVTDAPDWYAYLSDPRVIEHTSYPVQSPESVREMVERRIRGYAEATSCSWALARRSDDRLVGTCGFTSWSAPHGWAELAYDMEQGQWGAGLMSDAVRAALRWGFGVAGFNRVHALVMLSNARSIRLLEGVGFSREGCLRGFRIARGTPRDFWMYGLLRAEWQPEPAPGP